MTEVGICFVGMGGLGMARAKLALDTPGIRIVNVVDINSDRAKEASEELGCGWHSQLEEALKDDDVEVVMVTTPSGLHGQYAIQALEAGRHAITTKPMEVTLEKCDAMIAAADKSGKMLGVDFELRYTDTIQFTKHALDNGLFGKPILAETRLKWFRSQDYYDSSGGWRGTWAMDGGGSLANQTIHGIDAIVWLMGQPKKVTARVGCYSHDIETEDIGLAIIEFESGALGTVTGTTTCPQNVYWGMEVHGEEGGIFADFSQEPKWVFREGLEHRQEKLQRLAPHHNIFANIVSAVREGEPLMCDGRQGRMSIALLTAIYESARNDGKPVTIE